MHNSPPSSQEYKIPRLPLLDDMVKIAKELQLLPDLSRVVFIGAQHILETTVTLFDALIALGLRPENMYFSGKCYSTSEIIAAEVRKRGIKLMPTKWPKKPGEYLEACYEGLSEMWCRCLLEIHGREIDAIIILDDGFRCVEVMPTSVKKKYKIGIIEQTQAGLYSANLTVPLDGIPIIMAASSAVKKILEPPLIVEAIIPKINQLLPRLNKEHGTVYGVVGYGAIGQAICHYLLSKEYYVCVFDENPKVFLNITNSMKNFTIAQSIEALFTSTNVVFGCTGKDITEGINLLWLITHDLFLISCSSEDKEFKTVLKKITQRKSLVSPIIKMDPLAEISCTGDHPITITILDGGFPINFDRNPWNVPAQDIEVTQALLLSSCIQAIRALLFHKNTLVGNFSKPLAVDPSMQSAIAQHWLARKHKTRYLSAIIEPLADPVWIQNSSGLEYIRDPLLHCFAKQLKWCISPHSLVLASPKLVRVSSKL